jgi:AcrR family transcriptional regulator
MVQTTATTSDRAVERKRQILEGAARVFRRNGLHAAGMREIASELGMHVGNLYYYFENKQELLAFCQEDALEGLLELAAEVEAGELAVDRQLEALIIGHIELLNEKTPGSLAHLEVEALNDDWRERIQPRRDRYERVYRSLIRRGIEEGKLREVDPHVATMAVLGAVNWTVKWFRPEGRRGAGEIGRQFAALMVDGLRKPSEASEETSDE